MKTVPCQGCGAQCRVRRSAKTGRAWYRCDGLEVDQACGTVATFGPRPSRVILEPPDDDNAPAAADAADHRARLLI